MLSISKDSLSNVSETIEIETTDPETTINVCKNWLKTRDFDAIGIASFGPIDLDVSSNSYGSILQTPKALWRNYPILSQFAEFGVPVGFETDVNAAALAELYSGVGISRKITSLCYVTVGTGVGVGVIVDGHPVHGALHPEAGHIYAPSKEASSFQGVCPFHGNCIEGMVSAGSIASRKGIPASQLESLQDEDEVWDLIAEQLAHLCLTLTLVVSPQCIVLGGGVMQRKVLFPLIRRHFSQLMHGYVQTKYLEDMELYITPSSFSAGSGVLGSLQLAERALSHRQ